MKRRIGGTIVVGGLVAMATPFLGTSAKGAIEAFKYVAEVNGTGATSISNATPGTSYQVDLFLQSSNVAATASMLAHSSEDGLAGAGVKMAMVAGTSQSTPAALSGPGAAAFNSNTAGSPEDYADFNAGSAFAGQTITSSSISFHEAVPVSASDGVQFKTANAPSETTATQIYLGSVMVTAPTQGGTTNFAIGEYQSSGSETESFNNVVDLDTGTQEFGTSYQFTPVGSTTSPFSITTAVPEPTSISLLMIGGLLLVRRRRIA